MQSNLESSKHVSQDFNIAEANNGPIFFVGPSVLLTTSRDYILPLMSETRLHTQTNQQAK
jgi:hypothetical protein